MIFPIQGLRAVAALYVLILHSAQLRGIYDIAGEFCVAMFFIISGFLMAEKKVSDARLFTTEKVAKLYPVNIICLLVAVYIFRKELYYRWPAYICNFFLVQSWVPSPDFYFFSGDPVSWFLSDIMLAYLLFPYLSKLFKSHFTAAVIVFLSLSVATMISAEFIYPADYIDGLVYIAPYSRILDFMAGMTAGTMASRMKRFDENRMQLIALAVLLAAFCMVSFIPKSVSLTFWWYIPSVFLIISLSHGDGRKGFLGKLLSDPILVWLGNISFGIFMYHFPIIWIMDVSAHKFGFTISQSVQVVITLILTVIAADLSKKYFERPINAKIHRFIYRHTEKPDQRF